VNTARRIWTMSAAVVTLGTTAVAVVVLGVSGHGPVTDLVVGLGWGVFPLGWLIAVATFLFPTHAIRWRHRLLDPEPTWAQPLGRFFSKRLAISGERPWEEKLAVRRVRRFGLLLVLFWSVVLVVLLSAPPLTDRIVR
jgi:hypothetical protein